MSVDVPKVLPDSARCCSYIISVLASNVMDPSSIMLIAAPILFPVAMKLGIDRVTSAPFFALACTQQASIPPPPRSVYV